MKYVMGIVLAVTLLTLGLVGTQQTEAAQPDWITMTPVCSVQWESPNGETHTFVSLEPFALEARFNPNKESDETTGWDKLILPGETRQEPVKGIFRVNTSTC